MNSNIDRAVRQALQNVAIRGARRIQNKRRAKGKNLRVKQDLRQWKPKPIFGGQGMPIIKASANVVAAAVSQHVSGFNPTGSIVSCGTDALPLMHNLDNTDEVDVVSVVSLNPADPRCFTKASATANQYQKFSLVNLRLTYTPTAPSDTSGTLYIAVQPDPQAAIPTTVQAFQSLAGVQSMQVWGKSQSWTIDKSQLQQSYNVQQVEIKNDSNDDTTLNSAGVLLIGVAGMAKGAVIGAMNMSYSFRFTVPKLTIGSNQIEAVYDHLYDSFTGTEIPIDSSWVASGVHAFYHEPTSDAFMTFRSAGAPHFVTLYSENADGVVARPETSPNGTVWTPVPRVFATSGGGTSSAAYIMKACRYVRFVFESELTAERARIVAHVTSRRV